MRLHQRRLARPVITIQIDPLRVLPRVPHEPLWVKAWDDEHAGVGRPIILFEQPQNRQRPRRLITVHPTRYVEVPARIICYLLESWQWPFPRDVYRLPFPAML